MTFCRVVALLTYVLPFVYHRESEATFPPAGSTRLTSRSPPQAHLRRQHARSHHQRPEDRGREQPGVPVRRGRQTGQKPAGGPRRGSARGETPSPLPATAARERLAHLQGTSTKASQSGIGRQEHLVRVTPPPCGLSRGKDSLRPESKAI